jgi:hypothetical protein
MLWLLGEIHVDLVYGQRSNATRPKYRADMCFSRQQSYRNCRRTQLRQRRHVRDIQIHHPLLRRAALKTHPREMVSRRFHRFVPPIFLNTYHSI